MEISLKKTQKCQITNFKMFTGIKEALIMRIPTTNMHNLAVKRHKIMKTFSPYSAIREIKSPRKIIPLKYYKHYKIDNNPSETRNYMRLYRQANFKQIINKK